MIFCYKCGATIEEAATFCSHCGTKLNIPGATSKTATANAANKDPSPKRKKKGVIAVIGIIAIIAIIL